jgi:hypothetical protein
MSLNLSTPITNDGVLKLTPTELDYLQRFLTVHDRSSYYTVLYNQMAAKQPCSVL